MTIFLGHETVGHMVNDCAYHQECAPDGPTRPIGASEPGVENWLCSGCDELLIELETNLDTYGHNDSCDCDECLEAEKITLTEGLPAKCSSCGTIFDSAVEMVGLSMGCYVCSDDCRSQVDARMQVIVPF